MALRYTPNESLKFKEVVNHLVMIQVTTYHIRAVKLIAVQDARIGHWIVEGT
jgi:hypothetical protein